jgi:NADH-quinone oxidoreductase subunit C
MSVDAGEILAAIRDSMPDAAVTLIHNPGPSGQHSLLVGNDDLLRVMRLLRDELDFDLLSNVTGIDWPDPVKAGGIDDGGDTPPQHGFLEAVYHLFSTTRRTGPLVLRARTADRAQDTSIPSVVALYRSAEFQEREIYDLFGIVFTGHPDLRRILMWDEFADHPMRKDYVPPDDHEYEPTPHGEVLEKARKHYHSGAME